MVSALDSGLRRLGSSTGRGSLCVVFGKDTYLLAIGKLLGKRDKIARK